MRFERLTFSNEEILELKNLLEEKEKVEIICTPQKSGIWLHDKNWAMELRLLLFPSYKVTISRVCFIHRRQGIMTDVLDFLIGFCRKHGIQSICVQSVETKEMAAFCIKHGFTPNPNASFENEFGFIVGDYLIGID